MALASTVVLPQAPHGSDKEAESDDRSSVSSLSSLGAGSFGCEEGNNDLDDPWFYLKDPAENVMSMGVANMVIPAGVAAAVLEHGQVDERVLEARVAAALEEYVLKASKARKMELVTEYTFHEQSAQAESTALVMRDSVGILPMTSGASPTNAPTAVLPSSAVPRQAPHEPLPAKNSEPVPAKTAEVTSNGGAPSVLRESRPQPQKVRR